MKENAKALRHWPLCGEFNGDRWIPAQMASNAKNVSICWCHHENLWLCSYVTRSDWAEYSLLVGMICFYWCLYTMYQANTHDILLSRISLIETVKYSGCIYSYMHLLQESVWMNVYCFHNYMHVYSYMILIYWNIHLRKYARYHNILDIISGFIYQPILAQHMMTFHIVVLGFLIKSFICCDDWKVFFYFSKGIFNY